MVPRLLRSISPALTRAAGNMRLWSYTRVSRRIYSRVAARLEIQFPSRTIQAKPIGNAAFPLAHGQRTCGLQLAHPVRFASSDRQPVSPTHHQQFRTSFRNLCRANARFQGGFGIGRRDQRRCVRAQRHWHGPGALHRGI